MTTGISLPSFRALDVGFALSIRTEKDTGHSPCRGAWVFPVSVYRVKPLLTVSNLVAGPIDLTHRMPCKVSDVSACSTNDMEVLFQPSRPERRSLDSQKPYLRFRVTSYQGWSRPRTTACSTNLCMAPATPFKDFSALAWQTVTLNDFAEVQEVHLHLAQLQPPPSLKFTLRASCQDRLVSKYVFRFPSLLSGNRNSCILSACIHCSRYTSNKDSIYLSRMSSSLKSLRD